MKKLMYPKWIRIAAVLTAFLLAAGCAEKVPQPSESTSKPSGQTSKAESSKAENTESSAAAETSKTPEPAEPEIIFYHSDLQTTEEVSGKLSEAGVEITYSRFSYYDTPDGFKRFHLIIEYKNNGAQTFFTPSIGVHLYDGSHQEVKESGSMIVENVRGVMFPGETDYAYLDGFLTKRDSGGAYVTSDVDLSKGLVPVIEYVNVQRCNASEYTFIKCETNITTEVTDAGKIRFTGTITNPVDKDFSMIKVHYLLFDANDKLLAVVVKGVTNIKAKQTVEVFPMTLSNLEITPDMVAYCLPSAEYWWYTSAG